MNHSFQPSAADTDKCGQLNGLKLCGHPEIAHTNEAECDYCDYIGVCEADANNDLACPNCINKVIKKEIINTSHGPIGISEVMRKSREIDYSVEIASDIFNLETVAIVDIKKAILTDDTIVNKPNSLASALFDRITHFQKVIFDRSEENRKDNIRQRAYQVELNKVANELRVEEREKYRLIDINYKPREVKETIKVKKISIKKKIDKTELRNAAKELNVGEFVIQAICVSKNLTVEEAKNSLIKTMEAVKAANK